MLRKTKVKFFKLKKGKMLFQDYTLVYGGIEAECCDIDRDYTEQMVPMRQVQKNMRYFQNSQNIYPCRRPRS